MPRPTPCCSGTQAIERRMGGPDLNGAAEVRREIHQGMAVPIVR
jgi:hypothetical protein